MAKEIERKFLVRTDEWRHAADGGTVMRQGYLAGGAHCSARVRVAGSSAWLNLKSATLGVSRLEYEYEVPLDDAEEILAHLCVQPLIEKCRYHVPYDGHIWEVDCFEGDNAGLVVAELELGTADEAFSRPDWIGNEVSSLERYYNVSLVEYPYCEWSDDERAGR